jgi:hypothetical protein
MAETRLLPEAFAAEIIRSGPGTSGLYSKL